MDKSAELAMDGEPSQYIECIELQLSEIDILKSMFPDKSEFSIEEDLVKEMQAFVEGTNLLPPRLEYSIHLTCEKGKVSLHAAFPTCYPNDSPDIYVRSNQFSRQTQLDLNLQLSEFLESMEKGDLVIGSAVAWLQEHAEEFLLKDEEEPKVEKTAPQKGSFLRMWIYSHHIYSKVKRKDIKDMSEEYQVTGFCLPGKPGIICVEGLSTNIIDWWHMVRSWNWQKILCKSQEEAEISSPSDLDGHRRFQGFKELGSDSNIRVKSGGYHVDMGDLFRYLQEHDSGYMFEELFGFAGGK